MARKNLGAMPVSYPMPVYMIASYDENGTADVMNAAWGGISGSNEICMCIGDSHKSTENILAKKAFTVSMGDAAHVVECDYLGIVSAKNVPDKLERSGLTVSKSELVDAPVINELAVCLECRLKSYDPESHHMFGEIVNVSIDESAMTDGVFDITKACPICYDTLTKSYHVIGDKVGNAFKDGAKLK